MAIVARNGMQLSKPLRSSYIQHAAHRNLLTSARVMLTRSDCHRQP